MAFGHLDPLLDSAVTALEKISNSRDGQLVWKWEAFMMYGTPMSITMEPMSVSAFGWD